LLTRNGRLGVWTRYLAGVASGVASKRRDTRHRRLGIDALGGTSEPPHCWMFAGLFAGSR